MIFIGLFSSGGTLDTQTVTSGQSGSAPDRFRGKFAGLGIGSVSDGTSNIFGGANITEFGWDEASGEYVLTITGSTNTSWTSVDIALTGGGTKTLVRAEASSFAGGTWRWSTADTVTTQAFGASGSAHVCTFI